MSARAGRHRPLARSLFAAVALTLAAQGVPALAAPDARPPIPDPFDPHRPLPKPDLAAVKAIRFLTTDDYPPFHFTTPDGTLVGFDVDLTKAICADLKAACTIQARRFDQLVGEVKARRDDALIAALANTPAARADLDFTAPYYTTPARFVVRMGTPAATDPPTPAAMAGKRVAVEDDSAHLAYLTAFFPKAELRKYRTRADARAALRNGEVDALFGDAIGLAIWLNGSEAQGCCAFRGGPFTESRYFGNGVSIAVGKGNDALRVALDYELDALARNGTYADLYLKWFPIGFY